MFAPVLIVVAGAEIAISETAISVLSSSISEMYAYTALPSSQASPSTARALPDNFVLTTPSGVNEISKLPSSE